MLNMLNALLMNAPNDPHLLTSRGICHQKLGFLDNAVADFSSAISHDPKMWQAYCARVGTYCQQHDYASAMADANEAIKIKPNGDTYCNRATVYLLQKDYPHATQDFTKAMQLDAGSAGAYEGLGEISYLYRKYEQAIGYCNRAVYLNPHQGDALYFRGKSFEALGKKAEAQKDLSTATAVGYKPGEPFFVMKDK